MTALASRTGAANLGQGYPDDDGPHWIRELAAEAMRDGHNQYPPGRGILKLREAVAAHQLRHYGLRVDPATEVLITAGATEAIAASVLALAGAGDEVITLEPFYDAHAASIAMAGATHVPVPLKAREEGAGFAVDLAALEAAVSERTRLLILNSPHNPTGTVLSRTELEAIAKVARRADLTVITDEVYEHLVFDGHAHTPIATLPGMADRTLTISSAGKTFSLTGWKVGWVSGRADLIEAVLSIKQFLTYSGGAPFQPAIAGALTDGDTDIAELRASLARRRDLLIEGLSEAGFTVTQPGGTYFVCADASPFLTPDVPDGAAFSRIFPELAGVACVPLSAFCREGSNTAQNLKNWVRFTFVKQEETLRTAIDRLRVISRH